MKTPNDGRPILDFEIKVSLPLKFWKAIRCILNKNKLTLHKNTNIMKEEPLKKIEPIKPKVEPREQKDENPMPKPPPIK